jgi:hypothetical protein
MDGKSEKDGFGQMALPKTGRFGAWKNSFRS